MKRTIEIEVPEGYELPNGEWKIKQGTFHPWSSDGIMGYLDLICVKSTKIEPKKDFEWYVNIYFRSEFITDSFHMIFVNEYKRHIYHNPAEIPFEIKIGLLKFICDNENMSFIGTMAKLTNNKTHIWEICPKKFLESLF